MDWRRISWTDSTGGLNRAWGASRAMLEALTPFEHPLLLVSASTGEAEDFADAAAVEGHVGYGFVFDELAGGGGVGVEEGGGAGDVDGFGEGADGEGEIEAGDAGEFDGDAFLGEGLEAFGIGGEGVATAGEEGEGDGAGEGSGGGLGGEEGEEGEGKC